VEFLSDVSDSRKTKIEVKFRTRMKQKLMNVQNEIQSHDQDEVISDMIETKPDIISSQIPKEVLFLSQTVEKTIRLLLISLIGMYCLRSSFDGMEKKKIFLFQK
jgi:hypothetical protein